MMMDKRGILLIGVGALLLQSVYGQEPPAPNDGTAIENLAAHTNGRVNPGESVPAEPPAGQALAPKMFVQQAAQDGIVEVQLATLALKKSTNTEVRDFASRMKDERGKSNAELLSIAAREHINGAIALGPEHQETIQKLSEESGPAFDQDYAAYITAAHASAVQLFKDAASSTDSQIADFAAQTLPELEEHKSLADRLATKIKVASSGSSRPGG